MGYQSQSSEQEANTHQNLLEMNHEIKQRKTDEVKINHFSLSWYFPLISLINLPKQKQQYFFNKTRNTY